jgi:hypothetical protein
MRRQYAALNPRFNLLPRAAHQRNNKTAIPYQGRPLVAVLVR